MVNPKSVDSYHKLLEDGTLSRRQAQVYHTIMTLGKCTNRMIAKSLDWDINRVTGRVKELREKDIISFAGDYKDKDTNRTVSLWKVGSFEDNEPNSQLKDLFNQFKNIFS